MCELCSEISRRWPDDDTELSEDQFDELFLAAREVELLPGGPHSVGTGVTDEGIYTWLFDAVRGRGHAQ